MNSGQSKPLISVIVSAHDRKKFLKESVGSVLNQTLPRQEYEIIVVKNFHDREIDDYLKENTVREIYTEHGPLIMKHYAGIDSSSGEIICFLDDDDMFHPKKLELVKERFLEERISYYHNSYTSNISEFRSAGTEADHSVLIHTPGKRGGTSLREISRHSPSANPSSITISRELADFSSGLAVRVTRNVDVFWFISSLEFGRPIVIDLRKLVFYRLHDSGFSRATNPAKVAKYSLQTLYNVKWQLQEFHSAEALQYLRDVEKIWEYRYAVTAGKSRLDVLSRTRSLLFRVMRPHSLRYRLAIFFIGITSAISKRAGAYLYCRFIT